MRNLAIVLLLFGVGCLAVPLFFPGSEDPLVALGPMMGVLFLGVGAAMLVAQKICSK